MFRPEALSTFYQSLLALPPEITTTLPPKLSRWFNLPCIQSPPENEVRRRIKLFDKKVNERTFSVILHICRGLFNRLVYFVEFSIGNQIKIVQVSEDDTRDLNITIQ